MLNAMFKEFQRLLNEGGTTCGLFNEFNTQPWRVSEWREKYDNLGVLYINNGNLNKLPDGAMMEISYTLELFMRVDDNFNNSQPIVLPLQNLATGTTGIIYTENDDGRGAQYILDTGLPTSDGALIECGDCNYIRFQLPIGVVFTNGIALADNNNIVLTIDGKEYPALKSVISFVEAPQTQLETSVFVKDYTLNNVKYPAMQSESFILATGWNAQISKLYRPDQEVDVALRSLILDYPRKVVTVTYKAGESDVVRTHTVILHDCAFTNELGQATYLTINLSTAMRGV